MDALLSIGIGLGLSAACGFREFVPLLVASLAAQAGYISLAPGFVWVGTQPALYAFATATLLEVLAYYIPWLDNILDAIATPAAVIAGMLVGAAVFSDLPPFVKWSLAIIAGGAAAGMVQGATSLVRLKSTALSGGLANPVVSTLELPFDYSIFKVQKSSYNPSVMDCAQINLSRSESWLWLMPVLKRPSVVGVLPRHRPPGQVLRRWMR